ncbi:MAG: tetratricopeptide repeat protein, partial [Planctomycetota bacterium]
MRRAPYPRSSAFICGCLCLFAASALCGEAPSGKDLDKQSLPLRTALHHDPTMAAPFERLLALYRNAGRVVDLAGIYRAHLAGYPHDVRARTVLVRIMMASGEPEAARLAREATTAHPDNAYLRYLLYRALRAKHDPKALAELDRAIELEKLPGRRREWVEIFLPEARACDRLDLAEKHLRALVGLAGDAPRARLEVARKMIRSDFHKLALEVLEGTRATDASPEIMVEMELAAASAEAGLDRMSEAASRLESLLSKLTADHWRRPEILRRRMALVESEAERETIVRSARAAVAESPPGHPNHEAAVLDLAELLAGFERRRDALKILLDAGRAAPGSVRIEQTVLDLFDRLRDERGREKYLAGRIRHAPDRAELVLGHVKSLYLLGRRKEATGEFDGLLDRLPPDERFGHLVEMARFLRRSGLPADAADIFRRVVDLAPSRLDIRRELAETYLATGDRGRAAELFADELPKEAETEHLLDIVQFMIEQELYREARGALAAAAARDEVNLEIRTLLLTVEGRLANQAAGERLIVESRSLADTASRYRLWLESAVAFHDPFDTVEEFLDDERARLDLEKGGWSARAFERRMVFADVAARTGSAEVVAAMIREYLEGSGQGALAKEERLSPEIRIKLRRRLVILLEKEPGGADAVEEELKALIRDDPKSVDEYNARLALLYQKKQRADLAYPFLDKVNIAKLGDAVLLSRLEPLYRGRGRTDKVHRCLERLTALDPTNRGNWERWIESLAGTGDETRLRGTLLRLLAGIERMPMAKETSILLRAHLVDSYWRSI